MNGHEHRKVTASHLARKAYLYVRQSTLRQVLENQESTRRQYALRDRAVALGWGLDQVVVIDSDLGESGASAVDREGFQRLVSEVGLGHAGIVMGLEVSRLARNSSDWHRLLEICALSDTLILDEDGVYDPAHFNDRLLLGLKGAMSEAELHVLRARLQGGILSKARRGELQTALPAGFVYTDDERVVLDPDQRVRETIQHFFATFAKTGSASATVRSFRADGLLFPSRKRPRKGPMLWKPLTHSRALYVLHSPRYAGAFAYGRTALRKIPGGGTRFRRRRREEWTALVPGAHAGYISWEQYEANERRLLANAKARGPERARGPAREGPALLQGLAICGSCGKRMTIRYGQKQGKRTHPVYVCQRDGIERGGPVCQWIAGATVDQAVSALVVELMTPLAVEVAIAVQKELTNQVEQADALRARAVEQARYQAEKSKERYMRVDPANRLVADSLEADWNARLRALAEAQQDYERERQRHMAEVSDEQRAMLESLVERFPAVWNDPATPARERKRLLRLLVEDVTLLKRNRLSLHVRLRGGQHRSIDLPLPLSAWQLRKTDPALVSAVDKLIEHHTDPEVARILNERGVRSGDGRPISLEILRHLKQNYQLRSRRERMRERGLLTSEEVAERLGISATTVNGWRRIGILVGHASDGRGNYLYEDPGPNPPRPQQGRPRKRAPQTTQATLPPT
jgi:DNA invertase Pin-like site-specific DNA recombinase